MELEWNLQFRFSSGQFAIPILRLAIPIPIPELELELLSIPIPELTPTLAEMHTSSYSPNWSFTMPWSHDRLFALNGRGMANLRLTQNNTDL